jgi:hypothetical protein
VRLADPPDRGTVCNVVVPSEKVTLPVTLKVPFAVTLAVKVTGWHAEAGFAELISVRLVARLGAFTTWLTVFVQIGDPSPGRHAMSWCVPAVVKDV